jgi:hypothetical protein
VDSRYPRIDKINGDENMPLPTNLSDRDYQKYVLTQSGETAVRVAGVSNADPWKIVTKTHTFANSAGSGAVGTVALFTVTGLVKLYLYARCTSDITTDGAATVAIGTATTTAGCIASTTATNIDVNEIWHDATPDASIEASSVSTEKLVTGNIIATIATANMTGGVIEFTVMYTPISVGASVVAA